MAQEASTNNNDIDIVGLGYITYAIHGTSPEHLWDVMKQEIKSVSCYLPVKEVKCEEFPGFIRRAMTYVGTKQPWKLEHSEKTKIVENIYCDETKREIRFVKLNDANEEADEEMVHSLIMVDQLTPSIEYFQRKVSSKERVSCPMTVLEAFNEIERTADVARVIQRAYGRS